MSLGISQLPYDLLDRVRSALPHETPIYLVGGAVRDALLGYTTNDLDFVLTGNVIEKSRHVANELGAAFYPLDRERDIARVIFSQPSGKRLRLDFAAMQGQDLESDLRDRDFTINAMAIRLDAPQNLIDPLGGVKDLQDSLLRVCSPTSLSDDPVRILRAVRQTVAFEFQILPETKKLIRQASSDLPQISPERLRDEIFRIFDGLNPATAVRIMDVLGIIPYVLPELSSLKGIEQSPPHIYDVWTHTLNVIEKLVNILNVLSKEHNPETAANWAAGLISLRLGRYRQLLNEHLNSSINADRSLRALYVMAALYHDAGKAITRHTDEDGRIRFFEHDLRSAQIAGQRARAFHLSNDEIERLKTVIHNHMRPLMLGQINELPTRRATYRFFNACGPAGVDVCLLSLADTWATYGPTLPQNVWTHQLDVVRILLEAWWEKPKENINPPPLLRGYDLIQEFALKPGPHIGQLLNLLREAQAAGELHSREDALQYVRAWLKDHYG
jgi:tRNA nucleotidyltransferase/poly(A) polymerase